VRFFSGSIYIFNYHLEEIRALSFQLPRIKYSKNIRRVKKETKCKTHFHTPVKCPALELYFRVWFCVQRYHLCRQSHFRFISLPQIHIFFYQDVKTAHNLLLRVGVLNSV
jgi:hypothetical protein